MEAGSLKVLAHPSHAMCAQCARIMRACVHGAGPLARVYTGRGLEFAVGVALRRRADSIADSQAQQRLDGG